MVVLFPYVGLVCICLVSLVLSNVGDTFDKWELIKNEQGIISSKWFPFYSFAHFQVGDSMLTELPCLLLLMHSVQCLMVVIG